MSVEAETILSGGPDTELGGRNIHLGGRETSLEAAKSTLESPQRAWMPQNPLWGAQDGVAASKRRGRFSEFGRAELCSVFGTALIVVDEEMSTISCPST